MATAMLQDQGRHSFRAPQRTGQRQRPVTGERVTVSLRYQPDETPEQRRERHAAETETSRGMWK